MLRASRGNRLSALDIKPSVRDLSRSRTQRSIPRIGRALPPLASPRDLGVPHHHRAVPHPLGGAHADNDHGRAVGSHPCGRIQPVQPARGRRTDRPAHRLGDRRHVARPVGRDPARRRELRRIAVVVHLPGRGAEPLPVQARDPDPSGPGCREDPLQRDRRRGKGGAEQHALRHDPRQRRIHRGRGGGPRDPRGPRPLRGASLQREHGPERFGRAACGAGRRCAGGLRDDNEQLWRRAAGLARESARRPGGLRPFRRPALSSTHAGSPRTRGSSEPARRDRKIAMSPR